VKHGSVAAQIQKSAVHSKKLLAAYDALATITSIGTSENGTFQDACAYWFVFSQPVCSRRDLSDEVEVLSDPCHQSRLLLMEYLQLSRKIMKIKKTPLALVLLISVLAISNVTFGQTSKRRLVFLTVHADTKAMVGTQQSWIEMLQDVGADRVSAKTANHGNPTIEETETASSTVISISGYIVGQKLHLPGETFSIRDKARIKSLIQKLRDDGARTALAEKKAFGLTSEQLVGLHQKFANVVGIETKGQPVGDVVTALAKQTGLKFTLDPAARAAVNGDEVVAEELKGMSTGMALATIVRPLGLVVEPRREQGQPMEVMILDSRSSNENWPIGWPIEEPPVSVEPKLFTKIPIEIRKFKLAQVLAALQKRADVPFFYDQNSMAREGIELDEVRVSLVKKQITLLGAVSNVLNQTKPKMTYEIRLDENAKPFLWISVR